MTMRPESGGGRGPQRHRLASYLLAGVATVLPLTACDIPTELPELETRWVLPAEETRFGVDQLLPGAVSVTPDSSAFIVDIDAVTFSRTLGEICPACAVADGFTVPKPPFAASIVVGVPFPAEVSAIEVLDGEVEFELVNGFNFDPIRPADGVAGSLILTVTDDADGDVLGTLVVDGTDTAFGAGSTLTRTVVLQPGVFDSSLRATVDVDSPLGDPVTVDEDLSLAVTVTPRNIRIGGVTIEVAGQAVDLDDAQLDLEGVDPDITERLVEGAFALDVDNPFAISADFQISISGPTITTIQKSVAIGPEPSSTLRIAFSNAEVRSFLGEPGVVLSGGAVVDPGMGSVTVRPTQELVLTVKLDLTVLIGG